MAPYKELDKTLKNVRNIKVYDLYELNLESQKKIDEFYKEEKVSENDMMIRRYKLQSYIDRRNTLHFPILITIIWGLLVNLVFKSFEAFPNFAEVFQKIWSLPINYENLGRIISIHIMFNGLIIFLYSVLTSVFFIPLLPVYSLFNIGMNKVYQRKYELEVLDKKINEKLYENKNGKEYIHNSHTKFRVKEVSIVITMSIIAIIIALIWKIPFYKILVIILIEILVKICFKIERK